MAPVLIVQLLPAAGGRRTGTGQRSCHAGGPALHAFGHPPGHRHGGRPTRL